MMKLIVLACALACVLASDPPRPQPGANFESGVYVEFNGPEGLYNGEGFMAWSPQTNKAVTDLKLHHKDKLEPMYVFELLRNDLSQAFMADSADKGECRMRVVSGALPNYWGWLAEAEFVGIDYFKGVQIDLWQYERNGFAVRLGVEAPYYNTPFVLWEVSRAFEKITQFTELKVNATLDPKIFDVPRECQGQKATPLARPTATPARPVIPDNFFAEVGIESVQGKDRLEGEGVIASDFSKDMSVDDLKLHGGLSTIRVFELERFDLGKVFEIDSKDSKECRMREVTGHMPAPWDWTKKAVYVGQDLFRHAIVDLWALEIGANVIELGVLEGATTQPLFTRQRGPGYELINVFNKWVANPSLQGKYFDVPSECQDAKKVEPSPMPHFKFTKA